MREDIPQIRTTKQLKELARTLKVRADWHEPDEQSVEAKIEGSHLDNAMMELSNKRFPNREFNVIILQDKKPVAWINLANLFAMGCQTWPDTGEPEKLGKVLLICPICSHPIYNHSQAEAQTCLEQADAILQHVHKALDGRIV